jgi:WD40 repeat protein
VFGHDGNLLIHSQNPFPGSVLKYDSITGRKLGTWIPAETGGMVIPIKLAFAPDGNLLVLHLQPSIPPISGVLEFDGMSGAFLRELVPLGSCGLGRASDFSFGPNGDIYIVIDGGEDVFVFDRQTGACVGGAPLAGVTRPDPYNALQALEFSPHDGMLVLPWWSATASGQGRVTVHDPLNGNLLHTPIVPPAGGINSAYASAFGPNGNLFVAGRPDRVYQYDLVSQATLGIFASQNSLPSGADAWANEIAFQPLLGDANGDWTRDLADFAAFQHCFGSDGVTPADLNCLKLDYDRDGDVDPADGAALTQRMTGPK